MKRYNLTPWIQLSDIPILWGKDEKLSMQNLNEKIRDTVNNNTIVVEQSKDKKRIVADIYKLFTNIIHEKIATIDQQWVKDLIQMLLSGVLDSQQFCNIQLRIGMWANDLTEHPLRLPWYITQAIHILQVIKAYQTQNNIKPLYLPQCVVYFATNTVSSINNLNKKQAFKNQEYYKNILESYLNELWDTDIQHCFQIKWDVYSLTKQWNKIITDLSRELVEKYSNNEEVQKILGIASKHQSDQLDGVGYAIKHYLYAQDIGDYYEPIIEDEGWSPHPNVIMIWWKSEKDFWKIRNIVTQFLIPTQQRWEFKRVQLITKKNEIPPYGGIMLHQDITTADINNLNEDGTPPEGPKIPRKDFVKDYENMKWYLNQELPIKTVIRKIFKQ